MYKNKEIIRIRKGDDYRSILTETLPYEVPILFSNEGLYRAAKDGLVEKMHTVHELDVFRRRATIPFKYKIRKNTYEPRGLAVMHPSQQLEVGVFYAKYDHLLVWLCQRSPFTLRAPASIASYYVERGRSSRSKNDHNVEVEMERDGFSATPSTGTSYFSYRKYQFLYKFYDSHEFLRLEKKYKQLTNMDVSDCFNRIYTHTIAWAVKSKAHAKKNKGTESFEKSFDSLMQNANHGETAGIIIGPEISRVFAEIILQKVDLDIVAKAEEDGLQVDKDYTVRRYVDDYFIYSNTDLVRDKIKRIIPVALAEYKLAVNHAKTVDQNRPYITGTSISRHNIAINIVAFFDRYIEFGSSVDEVSGQKNSYCKIKSMEDVTSVVVNTISAIKRSVGVAGAYEATANYFFGMFKNFLSRMLSKKIVSESGRPGEDLYFFLVGVLDITFFYYAMSLRVRQTFQISEIILTIKKLMAHLPPDLKDSLNRKISSEARSIIQIANADLPEYKIEIMNLLLVLRSLGEDYMLELSMLTLTFEIEVAVSREIRFKGGFDYFQTVFLISYIGGVDDYSFLLNNVVDFSIEKFDCSDWIDEAEKVFLFFDLLSCPYISNEKKLILTKKVLRQIKEHDLNARCQRFMSDVCNRNWFFAWSQTADLRYVLKKKELRTAY